MVDIVTREVLADDVGTRAAVEALRPVRSVVDVRVSSWDHEHDRWRPLTMAEQKTLWSFRDRIAS
jgi:hypothetical protein